MLVLARPGIVAFRRKPDDRKPYKVEVITRPQEGKVGVKFSNGTLGTSNLAHLYPTWEAAAAVNPVQAAPRPMVVADGRRAANRWICRCGAVNLPGAKCWRCE